MGKYEGEDLNEYDFNVLLLNSLLHISNELAEANRLKRVELLKLKLPFKDSDISNWENELDDQA